MSRWTRLALISAMALASAGCSMCCGLYDYEYPMFQSRYSRTDPEYGRVGSIFSDPNVMPGSPALTNEDKPRVEEDQDDEVDPFEGEDPENLDLGTQDTQTLHWNNDYRWQ
jgi:hypothetical protein